MMGLRPIGLLKICCGSGFNFPLLYYLFKMKFKMKLKISIKYTATTESHEVKFEITFKLKLRWNFSALDLLLNLLGV